MGISYVELLNSDRILFGDFYESKDGDNRLYRQFEDLGFLAKRLYEYQEEYNSEMIKST